MPINVWLLSLIFFYLIFYFLILFLFFNFKLLTLLFLSLCIFLNFHRTTRFNSLSIFLTKQVPKKNSHHPFLNIVKLHELLVRKKTNQIAVIYNLYSTFMLFFWSDLIWLANWVFHVQTFLFYWVFSYRVCVCVGSG